MAGLYLWSPTLKESRNAIDIIVTRGDIGGIAEGTKDFSQGILKTLEIRANVQNWIVTQYRSKYFSEYLDETDWRDIWQPVWKIRINTKQTIDPPAVQWENGIGTDAGDGSWSANKRTRDTANTRCLVIADYRTTAARRSAEAAIATASLAGQQARYGIAVPDVPDISHTELPHDVHQLQIDLGVFSWQFFAEGAEYAEEVMKLCKKRRGTVHFQESMK